ncbi:MAG: hypothetical protein HY313_03730 [Acidobacteria bacterium]|nr:hypothetical protein [Acidobacteriota bacterium]
MKPRFFFVMMVLALMQIGIMTQTLWADKIELKDGTQIQGVVQKVEKGQVTVQIGQETKVFDILQIASMDFELSPLQLVTSRLPLEHFLTNIEVQEMVGHFQDVEKSATEVRKLADQTKQQWANRKTIEPSEVPQWEAAKERFGAPLAAYQENLNDLYFHVLAKVDEYNRLMKEADSLYVGVKGPLQVGSSLIPKEMEKLPLKKYVPSNWYDTIFYDGYNLGYNDAYQRYTTTFHEPPPEEIRSGRVIE